jgi:hypothetical protein
MIIVVYAIPYPFHNYSHGWTIMILEDCAIMIVKICSIKSNYYYFLTNEVYMLGTSLSKHMWFLNIGHLGSSKPYDT